MITFVLAEMLMFCPTFWAESLGLLSMDARNALLSLHDWRRRRARPKARTARGWRAWEPTVGASWPSIERASVRVAVRLESARRQRFAAVFGEGGRRGGGP